MNILKNISFSTLTTLKIGGPVKYFVEVDSIGDLQSAIEFAESKQVPYLAIGGGSNLLVSDDGFGGMVIKNQIGGIEKVDNTLEVGSGTKLVELVNFANENGIAGFSKLAGIPGTVGGAVYGNAGAYGETISDNLLWVEVLSDSKTVRLNKDECGFAYRDSKFKKTHDIILKIAFLASQGAPGAPLELQEVSKEIIETRQKKYHPGIACPGSFFKNIEVDKLSPEVLLNISKEKVVYGKIPAGWLLEEVGAKGVKRGGVEIAPWHGNLFMNTGGGTAKDFVTLAREYQNKVKEKFEINLEPEVQLVGFEVNPLE